MLYYDCKQGKALNQGGMTSVLRKKGGQTATELSSLLCLVVLYDMISMMLRSNDVVVMLIFTIYIQFKATTHIYENNFPNFFDFESTLSHLLIHSSPRVLTRSQI